MAHHGFIYEVPFPEFDNIMAIRFFLMFMLLFALGGCGLLDTWVWVDRTHTLPATGQGRTVTVESISASPGFITYAALVEENLTRHGYRPVGSSKQADLIAMISWRHEGCTSTNRSVPIYTPYYNGKKWMQTQTGSRIEVDRACKYSFDMSITDRASRNELYRGEAQTTLAVDDLESVVPTMISALFVHFPGQSGSRERESISD